MSEDYAAVRTPPRHPIQNLLEDVDGFAFVAVQEDGQQAVSIPLDGESRAHFKDMLMSAYATGVTKRV